MPDGGENRVEKGLWTLISEQSDIPKTFLGSTGNTTQNSITIGPAGPVLDAPTPSDNLEHHLREALSRSKNTDLYYAPQIWCNFWKPLPLWAFFLSRFSKIFWIRHSNSQRIVLDLVICFMTHTYYPRFRGKFWYCHVFNALADSDMTHFRCFIKPLPNSSTNLITDYFLIGDIVKNESVWVTNNTI